MATQTRLTIYSHFHKDQKIDISDQIELTNGKMLPGGWSTKDIEYNGMKIGSLYCGYPEDFIDGFSFEVTEEKI